MRFCTVFSTDLYVTWHELGYGLRHIKHINDVAKKLRSKFSKGMK